MISTARKIETIKAEDGTFLAIWADSKKVLSSEEAEILIEEAIFKMKTENPDFYNKYYFDFQK